MRSAGKHVRLFLGEHEREQADATLPQGEVCVRSMRSPDKTTPNEDAAAVIQARCGLARARGRGRRRQHAPPRARRPTRPCRRCRECSRTCRATSRSCGPRSSTRWSRRTRRCSGLRRAAPRRRSSSRSSRRRSLRCYHVGDSELLAVGQRGRIKQRVVPHSPTGFAVEAGLLDEDEAVRHDQRHVLFNVIGSLDMRVEVGPALELAARDTVLLASDGLIRQSVHRRDRRQHSSRAAQRGRGPLGRARARSGWRATARAISRASPTILRSCCFVGADKETVFVPRARCMAPGGRQETVPGARRRTSVCADAPGHHASRTRDEDGHFFERLRRDRRVRCLGGGRVRGVSRSWFGVWGRSCRCARVRSRRRARALPGIAAAAGPAALA